MARAVAKNCFTMVFDSVAARTDIGWPAKYVLSYMARKANDEDIWTGGVRMLGRLSGVAFQRIPEAVRELQVAGDLEIRRGISGQRASYRLLKASDIRTVSKTQSVRHTDGASGIRTEASGRPDTNDTETIESKKKPPKPPWKGGLESSLSPGAREEEKTESLAESGNASELHQAVVALFYPSGVLPRQQGRVKALVNDLATLSATPREVRRRKKRHREVYTAPCTLRSLVARWDLVEAPPPMEGAWDSYGEDES